MRIAMIGTRGVPARYGGFETAIEEVGRRLSEDGHEVVVYCRNPGQRIDQYRGMTLVNLPALRKKSLETLSHTTFSVVHALLRKRPDVVIMFNAANAPLLPILKLFRIPVAVHVDGLEWKRQKWAGAGARYYRLAEKWSVRWAHAVIADAHGISDHIRSEYQRESVYIPYGAEIIDPSRDHLEPLGLTRHQFHLVVARFEPENHVHTIVEGYVRSSARYPLIVVGAAPYSDTYTAEVAGLAEGDTRVRFLGSVWDQSLLNELYGNCLSYIHGHSVGGTNPSLLRAMGASSPVNAFDVVFNREVTGGMARFFSNSSELARGIEADERLPEAALARGLELRQRAQTAYTWKSVSEDYSRLCRELYGSAS